MQVLLQPKRVCTQLVLAGHGSSFIVMIMSHCHVGLSHGAGNARRILAGEKVDTIVAYPSEPAAPDRGTKREAEAQQMADGTQQKTHEVTKEKMDDKTEKR